MLNIDRFDTPDRQTLELSGVQNDAQKQYKTVAARRNRCRFRVLIIEGGRLRHVGTTASRDVPANKQQTVFAFVCERNVITGRSPMARASVARDCDRSLGFRV